MPNFIITEASSFDLEAVALLVKPAEFAPHLLHALVRERLRVALERVATLEEDLTATKDELQQYKMGRIIPTGDDSVSSKPKENGQQDSSEELKSGDQGTTHTPLPKRLSNGAIEPDSDVARVLELQNTIDKQATELSTWQRRVSELTGRISELEETLAKTQKELIKAQEANAKLQRDLRENVAQKEDQEERIATLEKRYLNAQRESTSLHDLNEKLEQELQHKEAQLKLQEEKIRAIQEKLELSEQKLAQFAKLPEMEEELKQRMEALTQVRVQVRYSDVTIFVYCSEIIYLDHKTFIHITETVKCLRHENYFRTKSNDRLQVHLKERMHALEEKNALTQELEKTRKVAEDLQGEKGDIVKELGKARLEIDNVKRQMLQQEIAFNIQQTDALTRSLSPSAVADPASFEWEKMQQAHVLANVQQAFDVSSDAEGEDNESIFSAAEMLSPSGHTDAQTLAMMLQEQLDAINNEIRLIQEEKQSTEARAEELESRVGSLEHMNLLVRGRSFERSSPPLSGRSTPKSHHSPQRDYLHKYHTLQLAPLSAELSKEELHSVTTGGDSSGAASPLTARSLRLERVAQALAQSQEELRSSQDSLHKNAAGTPAATTPSASAAAAAAAAAAAQKKKGIKSQLAQGDPAVMTSSYGDGDMAGADTLSLSGGLGQKGDFDRRKKKKHELLAEAMKAGTPFALWNGPTIVAWLELWVGMPAWYVAACRANVNNPLHRLKLRLAIQEMVSLTSPSAPKTSRTTLAFGDMNHEWIGNAWLPSLGLPQYRTTFMECLVDARMLDHLNKKDLRGQLKMVDSFHRTSLQYGISCLKRLNYDRKQLEERRKGSENELADVLVWSNERVIRWITHIGLKEYANNLLESGVHGALIALDESFDYNSMALALQIPTQNTQVRQMLEMEFNNLLAVATERRVESDLPKS
ncbi:Liprin-alpha-1 [Blattella germanica]|nr:Liprin-alpha-1 [Blattella germanica]